MMTIAQRALRNAIDLIASMTDEEARQLGREFFEDMGLNNTHDITSELKSRIFLIEEAAQKEWVKT